ncbi:ferrous iron transport protein B [Anaerovoracaceae bacterium SGI.195]
MKITKENVVIALAGNPNSGKTTLFNSLTGSNQYVGNWPGVTVEKKEGYYKKDKNVVIADLPGIYSLSPYTLEEVVARNYLLDEKPDAILNIIDGTNLERNLYLTTQLLELGIPVVIAVNMLDILKNRGDVLDTGEMSKVLGCPVVEISALKNLGVDDVAQEAIRAAKERTVQYSVHTFSGKVEHYLAHIEEAVVHNLPEVEQRWYSIKLFERDENARKRLNLPPEALAHIEKDIEDCEKEMDDDSESIITNERYLYIASIIGRCYQKKSKSTRSTSDQIDAIVTNRILALPIFVAVMFVVYYISVKTIGIWATDWTNDVLFGEAPWSFFGLFDVPSIPGIFESILGALNVSEWIHDLVIDGIVAGVGAVLGFLPQMIVLFLMLAFLESCGYMARVAFIMDRVFRKFGLSGRSFIPMLIASGCGVPAIMASRTIENERDRRMTIMTTTFIPCSAKLPIIGLIAGALFNGAAWVSTSAYFIGIGAVIVSGIILKKTKLFEGDPSPFVMELPAYHMPTASAILRSTGERASSFAKKAGTIILLATILVWFTSNFGWENGSFGKTDMENSILAFFGNLFAPIFKPLGWGNWRAAVAAITGLIAKENVVGTFGILYKGLEEVAENGDEVWSVVASHYTAMGAYSFLIFNLICAPCFAAIGAIRREMNSAKWTWAAIIYQTVFAYILSLICYQIWTFVATGVFTVGTVFGFLFLGIILYLLFRSYDDKTVLKPRQVAVEKNQM